MQYSHCERQTPDRLSQSAQDTHLGLLCVHTEQLTRAPRQQISPWQLGRGSLQGADWLAGAKGPGWKGVCLTALELVTWVHAWTAS